MNNINHDLFYFDGVSGYDSMYDSFLCFWIEADKEAPAERDTSCAQKNDE